VTDRPPPAGGDDTAALLAAVAHELKNALAPLGMTLQLVERQVAAGQPVAPADVAFARAQVRHLSALVDGLLDQGRLDLNALPFQPVAADLRAVVAEAVSAFRRAHDAPVVVELADRPLDARLDPTRIRQVLANLLQNAARYAPPGSPITVRARRAPGAAARVEVCDRGPGLTAEERDRVFERFVRGAAGQGTSGLGLGLYLCRAIVEQHGGRIGVDSAPGAGCTFWIDVPAA
jgi:signal transduction histidine kinase